MFVVLLAVGCSAQAPSPQSQANRHIEVQIRSQFNVPPTVNMTIGDRKPSDVPGFDTLPVTLQSSLKKQTIDFLISKDQKTLARLDKVDISADPVSKIDLK